MVKENYYVWPQIQSIVTSGKLIQKNKRKGLKESAPDVDS